MTWQNISDQVNRKLVVSAAPPINTTEMVGLLNETYDELVGEWIKLLSEKDEFAIQLLAPLLRPAIAVPITGGAIFYLNNTNFPGGCRWIASMRGAFVQACSNAAESRDIKFLSFNDISDLTNPLRKPTNDHPRYSIWWDPSESAKKVTLRCDTAPATVDCFYYMNQAVLASITGSPEVSLEGHWQIVKRAVFKQCGIDIDERMPVAKAETDKDLQVNVS